MFAVSYFSAFLGGLLTFFAPCTLPLIPSFIAFISGNTTIVDDGRATAPRKIFLSALLFVLGFTFVFMLFGLASGALGTFLVLHKKFLAQLGGVLVICFGLNMLGFVRLPKFSFLTHPTLPKFITPGTKRGGFLLGLLFALGWSPCLGPILGTILILAGTMGSVFSGMTLLFVYALGLALPFLVVALLYGSAVGYVVTLQKYLPLISRVGGVLTIGMGLLLLFGQFGALAALTFDPFSLPQLEHLMDAM